MESFWPHTCRFAYIAVADPIVSVLPWAVRSWQWVVGSFLMLLPAPWMHLRLHPPHVGWGRLVEGRPHLVMPQVLCIGVCGSAKAMEVVRAVWPEAAAPSRYRVVGSSSSWASLFVQVGGLRSPACICLKWSGVGASAVAVFPWKNGCDPTGNRNICCQNFQLVKDVIMALHEIQS